MAYNVREGGDERYQPVPPADAYLLATAFGSLAGDASVLEFRRAVCAMGRPFVWGDLASLDLYEGELSTWRAECDRLEEYERLYDIPDVDRVEVRRIPHNYGVRSYGKR